MSRSSAGVARDRASSVLLPVTGTVATVAVWWLATALFHIQSFLLPSPPDVVDAFLRLPDYLAKQTWVTLVEVLEGFGVAVVAGLILAIAIAASRVVSRAIYPLLVGLNAIPKLALAPLLVVWLGFDATPKIVMVVLICFFPIVISAATGLTSTPADLTELARALDARRWQTFRKIRFPAAMPQVFVGLKVAVSLAVIGAVIGEFAGSSDGLGYVIQSSGASGDTAIAFAALVILSVLSVVLFYLLVGLERLVVPWAGATSE
ncbi:MAG TPA: ABC transporter permease [Micromonosporaceae bacterium]